MATVNMDLSELEGIKSNLNKAEEEIKTYKKEKELFKQELEGVKNDKRVIRLTKRVAANVPLNEVSAQVRQTIRERSTYGRGVGYEEIISMMAAGVESKIRNVNYEADPSQIQEFVNFEDVKSELKAQIDAGIATELGELRRFKADTGAQIGEIRAGYEKTIASLNKTFAERNEDWQTRYDALQHDKDTRKREKQLEDRIIELGEELAKERRKKWYHKIF